jgi:hypothetical protein
MENKNTWIIGVVAVLVISAYLVGQNSNNQTPSINTPVVVNNTGIQSTTKPSSTAQNQQPGQTSTSQPSYNYPRYYTPMTFPPNVEAQRSSYVNSCITSSGGKLNYCNCSFDYLISNYGLIWLIEANANYNASGVIPPQLHSAQQYCSTWSN